MIYADDEKHEVHITSTSKKLMYEIAMIIAATYQLMIDAGVKDLESVDDFISMAVRAGKDTFCDQHYNIAFSYARESNRREE